MIKETLCWSCANACGGCEWSQKKAKPVPGWTAEKTKIRLDKGKTSESYLVIKCPKYKPDGKEHDAKRVKSDRKVTPEEIAYIVSERDSGRTYADIARDLEMPQSTVRANYKRNQKHKPTGIYEL